MADALPAATVPHSAVWNTGTVATRCPASHAGTGTRDSGCALSLFVGVECTPSCAWSTAATRGHRPRARVEKIAARSWDR